RAAVIYTLSGGQPRVIRRVIEFGVSPASEAELMRGALAYVEGHDAEAKAILSKIDAKTLSPPVAGHVAMIQSALAAKENPGEAMRLLDLARILAPGTLVEETALRRELVLADETADIDKFTFLSSEYIWRFSSSSYFDSFRQHFLSSVVHFGLTIKPPQFAALEELVGQVDSAGQRELYLQIAHRGIIDGKPGTARLAAEKALVLSEDGSVERARSKLYEAAALILTDQFEKGVSELTAVDASHLPKQDVEFKDAVASLAKMIGQDPANTPRPGAPEAPHHGVFSAGGLPAASALIDLAQQKLGQADEVLEGKAP
ncbi:MAG TPA: chemotaxis protein MotC, partial [Methylocella sp.]|nr:chemotaxis protein MotC [Methylocella sp.]